MDPAITAALITGGAALLIPITRRLIQRRSRRTERPAGGQSAGSVHIQNLSAGPGSVVTINTGTQVIDIDALRASVASEIASLRAEIEGAVTRLQQEARRSDANDELYRTALQGLATGDREGAVQALKGLVKQEISRGRTHLDGAARTARQLGVLAFDQDPTEAIAAFQQALELNPDDAGSWNALGVLLMREGALKEAAVAFERALALRERAGDVLGQAESLTNIGELHRLTGDLTGALKLQKHALSLHKASGAKAGMAANYSNIGVLSWQLGSYDESETMLRRGLSLERELNNRKGIASDHGNLGVLYLTLAHVEGGSAERLNAAEHELNEALKLDRLLNNVPGVAKHLGNLSMVVSSRADLQPDRRAVLLDRAEQLCHEALVAAHQSGDPVAEANQYSNLGIIMEDRRQMKEAAGMWRQAEQLYRQMGMATEADQMRQWIRAAGG